VVVLAACLLAPGWAVRADTATRSPGQEEGSGGGAAETSAPDDAAPARPQACIDGLTGPVRIQIGTVEAHVRVGQELPLPVRIKGVCDLAAFTLSLQLDGYVADLVRVEQTPFLQGDPAVDLEFQGIDPSGATRRVTAARPRGSGGVDGIGTLVRLIIRGRTPGSTSLSVVRPQLVDSTGAPIESFAVPVRITVVGAPVNHRGRNVRSRRNRRPH